MKLSIKKRITFVAFILCALLSVVGLIIFMLDSHVTAHNGGNVYASTELAQMKRGEKLAFSEVNEYFEEIKNKHGDKFQVHSQGAYHLSNESANSNSDSVSSMIYIDKDGYINATKTGVYQLEYTFAIGEKADKKKGEYKIEDYEACTFTALVCVYEGDEDKFEPLPDDPCDMTGMGKNFKNYIMTKDITWEARAVWTVSNFYGTLLNPNGYTLTWDIGMEIAIGRERQVEALFGRNHGYIDGLKVKVVGGEDAFIETGDFYGLVERNYGVLQNCQIEGTVKMSSLEKTYDPSYFYALPKHGFSFNNQARMTVYSNSYIYAYDTDGFGASDFAQSLWQSKDNKVYLDAWFYQDDIKAQRRVVKTILASEHDTNTCEHLILGKETEEEKTVTLQIPERAERLGEPSYRTINWKTRGNTPLAIDEIYWGSVRWGGYKDIYENLEVKHWLVNGEQIDTLNEVVVTEDLTIEPFVQYKETRFSTTYNILAPERLDIDSVYNASEILDFSNLEFEDDKVVATTLNCLGKVFADPRCVIPSKIVIGKNLLVQSTVRPFYGNYLFFLLDFLQNEGKLVVDGENPYVSFIDGKSFCNADGTKLYYYFNAKDETEVTLHPQITEVVNENTFFGGGVYEKLHLSNVESLNQKVGDYLTNLKEINLGKELDVLTGGGTGDTVWHFLSRIPTLEKVEVDEGHLKLKAEDSFVTMDVIGRPHLLYAPATLTGTVRVPEGIMSAGKNCFNGSDIQHLIFPDSFGQYNGYSVHGMKKLEKITFGTCDYLSFTDDDEQAELPSLTSIVFEGVKYIDGDVDMFELANIDTIVLPDNLERFEDVFFNCKAYQISENNPVFKTLDGVLYKKDSNELIQYPKMKAGDSYTVLEGTFSVAKGSFYETSLMEVIFPETCTQIGAYAFQNSLLESVEFKAVGEIRLFDSVFEGCKKLSNVTLPKEAKLRTDNSVFRFCESLKEFPYKNVANIGESAFRGSGIEYFEVGEGIFLGMSAFQDSQLKEVVIGATELQYINDYAFANTPLESVSLHSSIIEISNNAFEGCKNLKTIDLTHVEKIGAHAFKGSGIELVESESLQTLAESSFASCSDLTEVRLPNVERIPLWAFMGSGVTSVYMPKVNMISNGAFIDCERLVSVDFADRVYVCAQAFFNCKNLAELPFVLTGVDIQSFEGCTSLKKAVIEANIEERYMQVFASCTSLEEVMLTGENIAIGTEFFAGCTSLKKVLVTDTGMGNGIVFGSAFGTPSQKIEVYLNVPEMFLWKGKIPSNVVVFVPEQHVEKFTAEWLAEDGQIKGYDF